MVGDLSARGRQRTIQSPAGIRLESDLGRITAQLRLRWSADGGPRPAQVEAREWYLWDLRTSDMTLIALVNYSVTQGATSTLALYVPERLEVLSVKAGSAVGRGSGRLKTWRVTGTKADRQLEMEFQNPVRGEVLSVVQFAPHGPLNANDPLPIPLPRAARTSVGYLAYQLFDSEARIQAQGLTVQTVHERAQRQEIQGALFGDIQTSAHESVSYISTS